MSKGSLIMEHVFSNLLTFDPNQFQIDLKIKDSVILYEAWLGRCLTLNLLLCEERFFILWKKFDVSTNIHCIKIIPPKIKSDRTIIGVEQLKRCAWMILEKERDVIKLCLLRRRFWIKKLDAMIKLSTKSLRIRIFSLSSKYLWMRSTAILELLLRYFKDKSDIISLLSCITDGKTCVDFKALYVCIFLCGVAYKGLVKRYCYCNYRGSRVITVFLLAKTLRLQ